MTVNSALSSLKSLPYRMTPEEVSRGWIVGGAWRGGSDAWWHFGLYWRLGWCGRRCGRSAGGRHPPGLAAGALHRRVLGGRDSSVVLAVAQQLAEREGLAPPIAFTHRYPGLPEADEDSWQELVIGHLGVTEWVKRDALADVDLLGPVAQASLRRWGNLWPPLAHTRRAELDASKGGSLLSGEGGDEVLGERRLSPLPYMVAHKQPWSWRNVRHVVFAALPSALRRRRYAGRFRQHESFPWLTPAALDSFAHDLARSAAAEPLDWRRAVLNFPQTRPVFLAMETLDLLAADADVLRVNPLLSPGFLRALGVAGGRFGFPGRTAAMRALFSGLLPEEVLTRTSKCHFNRAVFGPHSRAFADGWSGEGVDPAVVDVTALRAAWSSPEPHAMTYSLLHSCWLAEHAA